MEQSSRQIFTQKWTLEAPHRRMEWLPKVPQQHLAATSLHETLSRLTMRLTRYGERARSERSIQLVRRAHPIADARASQLS